MNPRSLTAAMRSVRKHTLLTLVSILLSTLLTVTTAFAQQGDVTAKSLLAEAITLYEIGQQADGSVRRGAYEQALLVLDSIVERFPGSDLAVQILLGESVGKINVRDLRQAVADSASKPAAETAVVETALNRAPGKPSSPAPEDIAAAVTRCYASDAIGESDDAFIVLRVRLDATGRLTESPNLLAPDRVSAAERRLMRLASAALLECQPYSVVEQSSQVAIVFRAASVTVATDELLTAAQGSDTPTVKPIAANAPLEAPAPATPESRSTPNVQEREDALGLDRNARRDIQRRLVLLGFDTRGVDGMFGPSTRGAIANWQRTQGHPNSGFFDRAQLQDLTAESEIAFQEWSRQQVAVQPQPRTQTGAGPRQASPSGRYLDSRGCLRESDGRYVPNFKANCR